MMLSVPGYSCVVTPLDNDNYKRNELMTAWIKREYSPGYLPSVLQYFVCRNHFMLSFLYIREQYLIFFQFIIYSSSASLDGKVYWICNGLVCESTMGNLCVCVSERRISPVTSPSTSPAATTNLTNSDTSVSTVVCTYMHPISQAAVVFCSNRRSLWKERYMSQIHKK